MYLQSVDVKINKDFEEICYTFEIAVSSLILGVQRADFCGGQSAHNSFTSATWLRSATTLFSIYSVLICKGPCAGMCDQIVGYRAGNVT